MAHGYEGSMVATAEGAPAEPPVAEARRVRWKSSSIIVAVNCHYRSLSILVNVIHALQHHFLLFIVVLVDTVLINP